MTDLAGKRIAYYSFSGIIDSNGVTRIAAALNRALNEAMDEVYLCLTSQGGYVGDGIFLYNHIRGLPIKVTTHNVGSVASIAVAVFVGANVRYCSDHSLFMIHPTTLGPFQEPLAWERLNSALEAALAEEDRTESILRQRTRLPDDLLNARRVKDVHIRPQDALAHGLVDDVREFSLPKGHEIIQI